MNFPLSELDVNAYNDKIYELIKDDECFIFIDTNIIALLYGIHDAARKEFFDWIKIYIVKNRVKIPHWVINEYTNRFIRDKIQDYLNPLTKIKTIRKEFKHASAFLKMNIDSASLKNSAYADITAFHSELQSIEEKLTHVAFTAENKDKDYRQRIHKEIETAFGKCVLDCDIEKILGKVNLLGEARYNHKVPPGFQDEKKELNSFGDLILWHEILEYCKQAGNKKTILITNDEKKDWVYAPYKLITNGKSNSNKEPLFKIVDPRLVAEYKTYTTSEEFHIVNFEQLTKILIGKLGNEFIDLANALQIVHNQVKETVEESESTETTIALPVVSSTDNLVEVDVSMQDEKTETNHIVKPLVFSVEALKDRDFPLHESSQLIDTIINLKSHSWYDQNPAIISFNEISSKTIEENQTNSDALFVVGRNIYQSANGGSNSAIDYIAHIRDKFVKHNDYFINSVYAGIVFEIYFNANGEFRGDALKSHFANEVFNLRDHPRLKPARDFTTKSLMAYKQNLIYFPFEEKEVQVELDFDDTIFIVESSWFGKKTYIELRSIKINGKEALSDNRGETYHGNVEDLNLDQIIEIIAQFYAIPENLLKIKTNLKQYQETSISFKGKNLKNLSSLQLSF